jgi:type II restriction/modification system DNA methylase subunit YeeA
LAQRLPENLSVAFMGDTKGGAFDVTGDVAREWLRAPANPNGRPNSDVLKPWLNGLDITRRPRDIWIVDFGWEMSEQQAAFYEQPFAYVSDHVRPKRLEQEEKDGKLVWKVRRETYRRFWWRHVEPRPGMNAKLDDLQRFIATPTVARHRLFVWLRRPTLADHQLIVIARDDDTTFGILHSRFHELWALRLGTWLGVGNDPRYTPSTAFETFPFPDGLTLDISAVRYADDLRAQRVAAAARRLSQLRENWLNPPDLVVRVPEVVPGFPERLLPRDEECAKELKKRTLTKLYNQRPAWLGNVHNELDAAVAAAYGWPADLSDEEILARLFKLNQARAGRSRVAAA